MEERTTVKLLMHGQPPNDADILSEISVGIQPFVRHLEEKYLAEYITYGGSKIKFVTGRPGSGKTHFLSFLSAAAKKMGFVTVNFSAKDVWLHDFKEIYLDIFKNCDLMYLLECCAKKIIKELGYDPETIPQDMAFADYLSSLGDFDPLTKKEIRNQLQGLFLKNPLIDNNFAVACSLLTGGILGHPSLENANKELLQGWLMGSKEAKLAAVRRLGLSPSKITKYNARHMLRSLLAVHKLAGLPGILVTVDDMGILADSKTMDTIRYTKMKREDAYECIRELIDEIDTLSHIMFVFAFDRRLIDDETAGLKSYQALWLRIQNEIVSDMFNPFTDIIDLDNLGKRVYTTETILDLSRRLAVFLNRCNCQASAIDYNQAESLISNDIYSGVALPRQVGQKTLR